MTPARAMVLAAGLGLRMRPLTEKTPKPLIAVAGRTLLDRALDALVAAGITDAVVNCHYLPDQIERAAAARKAPRIKISREDALLETGGGIVKALPLLGDEPFFTVNADIAWRDGRRSALGRLAGAWHADVDAMLLLHLTPRAFGYDGMGDYMLDPLGFPRRRKPIEVVPYVYTGIALLHPRLFDGAPRGRFSLTALFDRAEKSKRLRAIVHDGEWFHIGTPDGLAVAQRELGANV
jgi:N-acetyl-alpha-D-muramate 1-phosphate uridylyltransferase